MSFDILALNIFFGSIAVALYFIFGAFFYQKNIDSSSRVKKERDMLEKIVMGILFLLLLPAILLISLCDFMSKLSEYMSRFF